MIDERQVDQWFSTPTITVEQAEAFRRVVESARGFAISVNESMPDGEDKNQVIQGLRQSILTVELAIRYRWRPLIATGISVVKN